MSREIQFSLTLRERPMLVVGRLCGAEPDVGIMSAYVEDYSVFDEASSAEVTDITEREHETIQERAAEYADEGFDPDDET